MKSEAVRIAQEETNRELIRAVLHPVVLFVGGVYAINWMADKPGGMSQAQAVALEALLGAVCAGAVLAPAVPAMLGTANELTRALGPALSALALIPK
jgi:hypothetical protein